MLQNVLFFAATNVVTRWDVAKCSQVQACLPNHVGVLWSFTVYAGQQVKEVYILNI